VPCLKLVAPGWLEHPARSL